MLTTPGKSRLTLRIWSPLAHANAKARAVPSELAEPGAKAQEPAAVDTDGEDPAARRTRSVNSTTM
jgi:hypothetical protein